MVHSSIQMFADDTKIVRTVNNPEQVQLLQDDLNALEEWSNLWQLRFNAEKCKVMHLDSRNKRIEYHMHKEGIQGTYRPQNWKGILVCMLTPS